MSGKGTIISLSGGEGGGQPQAEIRVEEQFGGSPGVGRTFTWNSHDASTGTALSSGDAITFDWPAGTTEADSVTDGDRAFGTYQSGDSVLCDMSGDTAAEAGNTYNITGGVNDSEGNPVTPETGQTISFVVNAANNTADFAVEAIAQQSAF